jgi:hypothetical protein
MDFDISELTPGIQKTVLWLHSHGFDTCDSGDGVTNVEAGMECAGSIPNVAMRVAPSRLAEESDRLFSLLLKEHGIEVQTMSEENGEKPHIEGTYSPADGMAFILLLGVSDEMLRQS